MTGLLYCVLYSPGRSAWCRTVSGELEAVFNDQLLILPQSFFHFFKEKK